MFTKSLQREHTRNILTRAGLVCPQIHEVLHLYEIGSAHSIVIVYLFMFVNRWRSRNKLKSIKSDEKMFSPIQKAHYQNRKIS